MALLLPRARARLLALAALCAAHARAANADAGGAPFAGFPERGFAVEVDVRAARATGRGGLDGGGPPLQMAAVSADGAKLAVRTNETSYVALYEDGARYFYGQNGGVCDTGEAPGALRDLVITPAAADNLPFEGIVPCSQEADAAAVERAHALCSSYAGVGDMRLNTLGPLVRKLPFRVVAAGRTPVALELPTLNVTIYYRNLELRAPPSTDFDHPPASECKANPGCTACLVLPEVTCFVRLPMLAKFVGHVCLCNPMVATGALAAVAVGVVAAVSNVQKERNTLAFTFTLFAIMMLGGGIAHSAFQVECGVAPATVAYVALIKIVEGLTSAVAVGIAGSGLVDVGLLPDAGRNNAGLAIVAVGCALAAAITAVYGAMFYFIFVLAGTATFMLAQVARCVRNRTCRGFCWLLLAGIFGAVGLSVVVVPSVRCAVCALTGSAATIQGTWYWLSVLSMASLAAYEEVAWAPPRALGVFTELSMALGILMDI